MDIVHFQIHTVYASVSQHKHQENRTENLPSFTHPSFFLLLTKIFFEKCWWPKKLTEAIVFNFYFFNPHSPKKHILYSTEKKKLIQVWNNLIDDNFCFWVNYTFNKNLVTSLRLQINDMKLLRNISHFTHYIQLILTMCISLAAWRERHSDFGVLPLSPAGIRAAVLRGSIALLSEVPRPGLWH